jgi:hypothetical protein
MVLRVDVVDAALNGVYGDGERPRTVVLSPSGRLLDDQLVGELAAEENLALLCGRYEGFDQRVHDHLADDEISIGRYVLAGGELPAMVIADAIMRRLPGALGDADSAVEESYSEAWRPARIPDTRPLNTAAGACRRCCFPAITPGCVSGDSRKAAGEAQSQTPRPDDLRRTTVANIAASRATRPVFLSHDDTYPRHRSPSDPQGSAFVRPR